MADIQVNDADWNALGAEAQSKITQILQEKNLLKGGSIVASSSGVGLTGEPPEIEASTIGGDVVAMSADNKEQCLDDCSTAENAAAASCALLAEFGPLAVAACLIAVRIAGNDCRRDCREG